ncbi:peroxisomal membrane protein PEX14 [Asparagus officinalis]|uniref:peroxisomal membrane protein PEX14 n=1 Tax=Asparagus officinalis TaxID=4686 RepID=UPI00098E3E9E|nr:peroxisomal membrane protein PEX14 [Asparagus officinalis]
MATRAPKPQTQVITDQNPQSPVQGTELSKPVDGNGQAAEAVNDISERPFLAPSEPMREDQVQNAVKFLSHPKVRGSPVIYRRSFLEKKGLTKEEIDEAFHRVPDPPSNATSAGAAVTNQVARPNSSTSLQAQAPTQAPQPASLPVNSASIISSVQQSRFQWSHALIAVGVLAASGAGSAVFFKKVVVPRLKTWIKKVVAEEKESEKEEEQHSVLADQTAEAAKAAATAAAVVAKASEELLKSKNEERKYFEAFMSAMDVQVKEMKSMGEAIRKLESSRENSHSKEKMMEEYIQSNIGNAAGTTNNSWRTPQVNLADANLSSIQKQVKVNGTNPDYAAVRPSSAPSTVEPAPHPKSYMEIMAMVQRGERPPNIRDINDMPPNPNQEPSKSVLAPRPKPWEVPQQNSSEVLSSSNEDNGLPSYINGKANDSSEPWWKRKAVKITELETESKEVSSIQRSWVPPQPPGVAIAVVKESEIEEEREVGVEMS